MNRWSLDRRMYTLVFASLWNKGINFWSTNGEKMAEFLRKTGVDEENVKLFVDMAEDEGLAGDPGVFVTLRGGGGESMLVFRSE